MSCKKYRKVAFGCNEIHQKCTKKVGASDLKDTTAKL